MSTENPVISGNFRDPAVTTVSSSRSNVLAFAEGILLLGGVALIDHSGLMSFSSWPVHPFLFITVLLSAQYGVLGGVLTAVGATAIVYFNGLPARPFDMSHAEYFRLTWADPLSWVLAALMVGIVTSHRGRMLEEQGEQLRKAVRAESLIAAQYQVLAQRTHKLERSLAGRADLSMPENASPLADAAKSRARAAHRPRNKSLPSIES
ncbi:hypothetical protein [Devosia riboflavina]